ncbi:M48 family metallopeptidase [Salipiger sp.]|uniref:M48 family metallopeptidase n=1 Tax=Salipiger sp. TaxID=2078585 RepID=UPI003A98505E
MRGKARFYDGLTAIRHEVEVRLSEDSTALLISGTTLPAPLRWPLPDLRALRDHGDPAQVVVTRHLEVEDNAPRDPARLLIDDPEMAEWLRRTRPRLWRRDVKQGTGRRIAIRAGVAVGAVLLMLFVILPSMADTLARLLPVEREVAFGRSVTAQMARFLGGETAEQITCTSPDGNEALQRMVDRLTDGADLGYDLNVVVFDNEMVNAFAAPGGQVVIVRGLIDKADSPDMVAAVLAHEIGHVVHRDPTRGALRAAGSVGLLGLMFGDFTGGAAMAFLADRLLNAQYSQEAESQADRFAHAMLRDADLPPGALADMFERFRAMGGDISGPLAHFMSHPRLGTRIDAARAATPDDQPARPSLDAAGWAALRGICRDKG